jgi:hypothetical protein
VAELRDRTTVLVGTHTLPNRRLDVTLASRDP